MEEEPECCSTLGCGCCCSSRFGVIIYTSIFIAFSLFGFYNYVPSNANSPVRLTFVTDSVVADATAFCTDAGTYCELICDCDGEPCDMEGDIGTLRAAFGLSFALQCIFIPVLVVGLYGAIFRKPKVLQFFAVAVPTVMILMAVASILMNVASNKAVLAWHQYNAEEFGDPEAACTKSVWGEVSQESRKKPLPSSHY